MAAKSIIFSHPDDWLIDLPGGFSMTRGLMNTLQPFSIPPEQSLSSIAVVDTGNERLLSVGAEQYPGVSFPTLKEPARLQAGFGLCAAGLLQVQWVWESPVHSIGLETERANFQSGVTVMRADIQAGQDPSSRLLFGSTRHDRAGDESEIIERDIIGLQDHGTLTDGWERDLLSRIDYRLFTKLRGIVNSGTIAIS